jgi:hypothetical protein
VLAAATLVEPESWIGGPCMHETPLDLALDLAAIAAVAAFWLAFHRSVLSPSEGSPRDKGEARRYGEPTAGQF